MDISTYTAPCPLRQSAVTRRLAFTVGLVFVAGVAAAAGALFSIARHLDNDHVHETHVYSARALENRITASKNYITSYAYWNTAYEHLGGEVDVEWAYTDQNMGKTLFTKDGYDGVFVLDREHTKYALVKGQLVKSDISAYLKASASALVDQVQAQSDLTKPISAYSLFEGWPALVIASAILPNDERPMGNPKTTSVLVFVDKLTPTKLRKLGSAYGPTNLALAIDTNITNSPQKVTFDSTGSSLIAELKRPGRNLLWSLLPILGCVLMVLIFLMAFFFWHALRASQHIDNSFDAMQNSHTRLKLPTMLLKPAKSGSVRLPKRLRTGFGRRISAS